MTEARLLGYFDDAAQTVPVFDPGLSVPCPFCAKPLTDGPRRTVSLMAVGGRRSWFYRVHRDCDEALPEEEIAKYEEAMLKGAGAAMTEARLVTAT